MLIVAALGGNALLKRGETLGPNVQERNARTAAESLAELLNKGDQLIITHGNGPQVGLLALQQELAQAGAAQPLDVLDAATEGMIGYILARELGNVAGRARPIATVLTQVEVDRNDPAFRQPTKFIGPLYEKGAAERLAASRDWKIAQDGEKWRRVVASPNPVGVVELDTLKLLLANGVTVICGGGGGIPVRRTQAGELEGVEAVIDKDLVSAFLATDTAAH
jgi:carbamate kinase